MAKRPRGFLASYNPRGKADLLLAVEAVLAEYQDQLPLTARQIFYRLVGAYGYEKTERSYQRLCEMLVLARRGRRIPFESIRDDGPAVVQPNLWQSGADWLTAIQRSANEVRLSPWEAQPFYVEVIAEAGGMVPMLASVADPYGITVRSGGGFDSLTAKHELARHYASKGKPCIVLHVGDFDPSGEALWHNLNEDVGAFVTAMGGAVTVERIAVTPEHRDEFNLPTAPPKKTDKRSVFPEGEQTVQAEALPPDLLQEILRNAIEARIDLDALAATKAEEASTRQWLSERLSTLTTE